MPIVTQSATVAADSPHIGQRADRLVQELTGFTRAQTVGLFDHNTVTINQLPAHEPGQRLAPGDSVVVTYDNTRRYHPQPRQRPPSGFDIVHEDRDVIVVHKPPDLLTVPTPRGEGNTLLDFVSRYVSRQKGCRGAFVVHRLDRGVSGLLVFGKSREAAERIRDQFEMHKPQRQYVALVAGKLQPAAGTFESYLATDKSLNRFSTDDTEIGQLAITHFETLEPLETATLVKVWLETGRRNQIRVHFAEAGYPVLGDPRYRPEDARHRAWTYRRLALHAQSLAFDHPVTGETLQFTSQLPPEMIAFLSAVRPRRPKGGRKS